MKIPMKKIKGAASFVLCVFILLVMTFPFLMILLNSFKGRLNILKNPLEFSGFIGFENYKKAFTVMHYGNAIKNSIIITVFSLLLIVVFSSMLAYLLVRWKWKLNKVVFLLLTSSMIIPFQTLMIPLVSIYGKIGILNSSGSLLFFYLGFGMAMATFMYHGFIKNIPIELEEAALLDGCGHLATFWKIVFPNLKPITSTIVILDLLWIWNDYLLPSLVLTNENQRTLPLSTFYFFGNYTSEFGLGMAALVMSILPILILYLLLQRQIISGVMAGSGK
ncbi:sugar ABC transporter permease [Spirochaetia bacterium]|nr:sugar ABC transporter permease [Spirochaetia bacterium]GHV71916.1 sugar ABC transporter permease [Spirochaetia bacterium]